MEQGFFRWASGSLAGHLALFELFVGGPAYLAFMAMFLFEGRLTLDRAFYVAIIVGTGALAFATFFWFLISKPLIKSRRR